MGEELTVLLEMLFDYLHCEGLVDSGMASLALVPTPMWNPLVLVGLPWCFALVDEALLVLFGSVPGTARRLFVDVVLWIFEDLLQSGCRLFVDLQMIEIKGFLPVFSMAIIECRCSLVGSQCSVPLTPAEVGLIGWCVWRPVVLVDVQGRDPLEEIVIEALG